MTTLIARETRCGQYDMDRETIIVDHPEHGRLLLVQGFGGLDSLRGGAYRWEHGAAYQLRPDDALKTLSAAEWNENMRRLDAVLAGADPDRPDLLWSGDAVRAVAESASSA